MAQLVPRPAGKARLKAAKMAALRATERIFRHAVPQAQTSGSARALLARAF